MSCVELNLETSDWSTWTWALEEECGWVVIGPFVFELRPVKILAPIGLRVAFSRTVYLSISEKSLLV